MDNEEAIYFADGHQLLVDMVHVPSHPSFQILDLEGDWVDWSL